MKLSSKSIRTFTAVAAVLILIAGVSACNNKKTKPEQAHESPAVETTQVPENQPAPTAAPAAQTAANPAPAAASSGSIKLDLPPLPEKPAMGREAAFSLIYTTSVSGELIDCGCPKHPRGGLARRVKWIEDKQQQGKPVLQLDAGNLFFPYARLGGTPDALKQKKAQVLARAMNKLKIDAINVGGQDLMNGLDFLKQLKGSGKDALPIISANLREQAGGDPVFPAYKLIDIAGARIGVIGLIEASQLNGTNLHAEDPSQTAAKVLEHIKPGCDLVVVLWAGSIASASTLAKSAPGIDIIIASDRSGSPSNRPLAVGDSILTQSGNRGMFLGDLELTLFSENRAKMTEEEKAKLREKLDLIEAREDLLFGTIQRDPTVNAEYQKVHAQAEEIRKQLAASSSTMDYEPQSISVDMEFPEDPETAKWVREAM